MLYDMIKDELLVQKDLRRGENTLRGLGYAGWTDGKVVATFEPQRLAKGEKSASPFRAAAFQGRDGTVYETGPFHDIDSVPAGVEVSAEGFVDHDGRFHSREQATELLHFDHPVQSEELDLKKSAHELKAVRNGLKDLEIQHLPPALQQLITAPAGAADISNAIGQHEQAISNHIYGAGNDYLICDQAASLLRSVLRQKGIPHQGIVGMDASGAQSHAWTRVNGQDLDPTNQGFHPHGQQVMSSWEPNAKNATEKYPGKLQKSFSEAASNYLGNYSPQKIQAQEIHSRLREHKETLEGLLTPGGQHPAFSIAARMAGHPADAELRRQAEEEYGDDVVGVALAAHGLDPHDESLRMSIEAAIQDLRLTKSEFNVSVLPRVVMPGQDGAEHMAMVIRRAFAQNLVYEVRLGGKHSAGTAVAYDREADRFWLLKPGSSRVSPALGVSETPYSQSRREAAFAQAARAYESMRDFYPECWLLVVDGVETACMEVMGPGYRPAQKYGDVAELLKPYQDSLDIFRWAFWDWVLGNPDDHGGNVLVTEDGRVALIDHGSALAGNSFNPPQDLGKSFIPYYLRVNYPIDWNNASPAERYRCFPHPTPEERDTLKAWFKGLGGAWQGVLEALAPQALPPARARADRVLNAEDPADALLRIWAGLPPDAPLQKGEGEFQLRLAQFKGALSTLPQYMATPSPLGAFINKLRDQFDAETLVKAPHLSYADRIAHARTALHNELHDFIRHTPARDLFGPIAMKNLRQVQDFTDRHADALAQKYIEHLNAMTPSQRAKPLDVEDKALHGEVSGTILSHATEHHVLQALKAAEAHKDLIPTLLNGAYMKTLVHNTQLGQKFADWAADTPGAQVAFTPIGYRTGAHARLAALLKPSQVRNMLSINGVKDLNLLNLLKLPQLTDDEAVDLLKRYKDPDHQPFADGSMPLDNAGHRLHDFINGSYTDDSENQGSRMQRLRAALLEDPRTLDKTKALIAQRGGVPMRRDQLERVIDYVKSGAAQKDLHWWPDIGFMLLNQIELDPQRTDLDDLGAKHASSIMRALGKPSTPGIANFMKHGNAWVQRLQADPANRHAFEDAATRAFWHGYEIDVSPHHFAVMEKHRTKSPVDVQTRFFRGNKKGDSAMHPLVTSEALDAHAKRAQQALLADPHAAIKGIGGKPHVLVYRGVSGNYAAAIMQKSTFDAEHFKFPNAQMSSWSGSPKVAEEFARRKISGQAGAGIVMRRWMPVEDIVHSGCHVTHPEQKLAHPGEHELVFMHRPEDTHMTVDAKDISVVRLPKGTLKHFPEDGHSYHPLHAHGESHVDMHPDYIYDHGIANAYGTAYGKIGTSKGAVHDHEED